MCIHMFGERSEIRSSEAERWEEPNQGMSQQSWQTTADRVWRTHTLLYYTSDIYAALTLPHCRPG